jgi:hypothetical protein
MAAPAPEPCHGPSPTSLHGLERRLDEVLGPPESTTLMEHLPPVGWADVATKADLAALEQRLEAKIEAIVHRELHRHLQVITGIVLVALVAMIGLVRLG